MRHLAAIITAQESSVGSVLAEKLAFYKVIQKMGAAQTKTYNCETGLQISSKFGTDVAICSCCVPNLKKLRQRLFNFFKK